MNELTPEQRAGQQRIHELLAELAELIGPSFGGDIDDGVPMRHPVLSEWVLVMAWLDLDDGDTYLTRIGSADLLEHHRVGLLHEALYGFD